MKLFILSAACLSAAFLFPRMASAQDNMSLGPKAGFGHSWINGQPNKYQPYGQVGATFTYSPLSHIGFGADLLYSIEGGRRSAGDNYVITKLDYLRVPVTTKYFFGQLGDRLRPRVELGPSLGFAIGGHRIVETADKGEQISRRPTRDFVHGVDLGITAGAGINYRLMSNTWLLADLDYYHGLTKVYTTAESGRNRNIGFNLGLAFGIGQHKQPK